MAVWDGEGTDGSGCKRLGSMRPLAAGSLGEQLSSWGLAVSWLSEWGFPLLGRVVCKLAVLRTSSLESGYHSGSLPRRLENWLAQTVTGS